MDMFNKPGKDGNDRLEELFKLLKEEAGDAGTVIVMRAKGGKGENFRVLTDGHMHSVLGLMTIGSEYIQDLLRQKVDRLIKGEER